MLDISSLKKSFKSGFTLDIDDLNIGDGERVALIGENGSGKSTLLRLIAGIIAPDEGAINNVQLSPESEDPDQKINNTKSATRNTQHATRLIGYQPQAPYCFRGTARYNIRLGQRGDADIDAIIDGCRIKELADKNIRELSGGERQRVCFARMLAGNYGMLLLDEPFSQTDIDMSDYLCDYLVGYCKKNGATLIMSTHTPAQALSVATKILILNNGKVAEYSDVTRLENPESEFGRKFVAQWRL